MPPPPEEDLPVGEEIVDPEAQLLDPMPEGAPDPAAEVRVPGTMTAEKAPLVKTGKMSAKPLGGLGDSKHDLLVAAINEVDDWYRQVAQDPLSTMNDYWRLYMAERDDLRRDDDLKRAQVFVPYPYSGVETQVAAIMDVIGSADPLFQVEGTGDEDEDPARGVEGLCDYTFRRNLWRKKFTMFLRERAIQGAMAFKVIWTNRSIQMSLLPDDAAVQDFKKAIIDAVQAGAPNPPDPVQEPDGFATWRELVNTSKKGRIPDPPYVGRVKSIQYRGPWLQRLSLGDVHIDPSIEEMSDQPVIIHRIVKHEDWVRDRAEGPGAMFNKQQVDAACHQWDGTRVNEWDQQIAQMLGISNGNASPLRMHNRQVELLEVFIDPESGFADPEVTYAVILNRQCIINNDVTTRPFMHGGSSIHLLRNVSIPGAAYGISEFRQPGSLYKEMNVLRGLRIDRVLMETFPAYSKLRTLGMPEMKRRLRPGAIIDVDRPDAIQPLFKGSLSENAFREIAEIKGDIDEANSTFQNLRGAPSTVGRVSATESERRVSQALMRMKLHVLCLEDELLPALNQIPALWYQKGDPKLRIRVTGRDTRDPFVEVTREQLMECLGMDFRFRGASLARNPDMIVQQMMGFVTTFREAMTPPEVRAIMRRIWASLRLPGVKEVVTEDGTRQAMKAWEMQQMMAAQQGPQGQGKPQSGPPAKPGDRVPAGALKPGDEEEGKPKPPSPGGPPPTPGGPLPQSGEGPGNPESNASGGGGE